MVDAQPVVLLHGFAGSTRRTWQETGWLDLLRDVGRTPIGVDLLGHGDAAHPTEPAAYDSLESEALERFPRDPVDVISFSAGGRVALDLSARHPQRFGRIVIAGLGENVLREQEAGATGSGAAGSEVLAAAIEAGETDTHPFMRWLTREASETDLDRKALAAFLRRPNPPTLDREVLTRVHQPVLLVMGDKDRAGPAEPLAAALPNASVAILPGVDHFATPRSMAFMDAAFEFLGIEF